MLFVLLACQGPEDLDYTQPSDSAETEGESSTPDSGDLGDPCAYEPGLSNGAVENAELTEISGMARIDDTIWVHNDSANNAYLYAVGGDGSDQGYAWIEDYLLVDAEDMAKFGGKLYLGDIGDNGTNRDFIRVFRFPEPDPGFPITNLESWHVEYPDGPHDAEAMTVDQDGTLYILTKSADGATGIYARPEADPDETLELVGEMTFGTGDLPGSTGLTSADSDETRIVLRTYTHLFLWQRRGRTLPEALATPPDCLLDIVSEPQGEAVALTSIGLMTLSEGEHPTLWNYKRIVDTGSD